MSRFAKKEGLIEDKKQSSDYLTQKTKRKTPSWLKDLGLSLVRIVLAVVAVSVAIFLTKVIVERVDFWAPWYIQAAVSTAIGVTILLSLGAAFPSNEGTRKTRKVSTGLVILFLLGWYALPALNQRNFDENHRPTKWVSLKTGKVYNRALNPVDSSGKELFFLHPENILDTCVLLTKDRLNPPPKPRVKYSYIYDTVFNKVYNQQGKFRVGIYGADIQVGDKICVQNENGKGLASIYINDNKQIFAGPLKREETYTVRHGVSGGKHLRYLASNQDGSVLRVQLLRGRYVQKK